MNKVQLAKDLRQIEFRNRSFDRRVINEISDDDIIDYFNTCDCCGRKQVSEEQLKHAISVAKNVNDFFKIKNKLISKNHEFED